MINLNNLSKSFRKKSVLDAITLQINSGDRVAIIGSNGAGKTTLIRCLLGEYTYDGSISINGLEPRAERENLLKSIGFVPQLPPPLKIPVGQLIHFAASVCDSNPDNIYGVADQLGLDAHSFRQQPFVKLSGGQKQKLLISIALGREAKLLIMDEPAANLDPTARQVFFSLLSERRHSSAMLISSHRLDEVSTLVNRVLELDQGKVVLDDRVADDLDMDSILDCKISLVRQDKAFEKTLLTWDFTSTDDGIHWAGTIAGPDRLSFLGVLSRYTALLKSIDMNEASS